MNIKVLTFALLCLCVVSPALGLSEGFQKQRRTDADLKCELCEFIVGWIEGEVKNGTEEHRIAEEIGFACKILPWPLDNTCVWMVQQFVSVVINLLEDVLPPSRICYIVNMCASLQGLLPQVSVNELQCTKCMFYTRFARYSMQKASSPQSAASICSAFKTAATQRECVAFLNQPDMFAEITSEAPFHEICARSSQCTLTGIQEAKGSSFKLPVA